MTAVRCSRHGRRTGGTLVCRHIASELHSASTLRPHRQVKGDLFDDGHTLPLVLCLDCVEHLGVGDQVTVSSQVVEAAGPFPVCRMCFDELLKLSATADASSNSRSRGP